MDEAAHALIDESDGVITVTLHRPEKLIRRSSQGSRRDGMNVASAELFAYARTRLADDKTPRRAVVVDELPRKSMGKVLERELRDQLGNG